MKQPVATYFVFQTKTVFIPFRYIYPECLVLIEDEPKLYPLLCMKDNCHRNSNCAEKLAHRVHYFFDKVEPKAELMIAYFKYQDRPGSIRAGVFTASMDEPRLITCNRSAFQKFQRESEVFQWVQPNEFLLIGGGSPTILPVESLVRGS